MLYMDDAAGAVKGGNASVYRAYDARTPLNGGVEGLGRTQGRLT